MRGITTQLRGQCSGRQFLSAVVGCDPGDITQPLVLHNVNGLQAGAGAIFVEGLLLGDVSVQASASGRQERGCGHQQCAWVRWYFKLDALRLSGGAAEDKQHTCVKTCVAFMLLSR